MYQMNPRENTERIPRVSYESMLHLALPFLFLALKTVGLLALRVLVSCFISPPILSSFTHHHHHHHLSHHHHHISIQNTTTNPTINQSTNQPNTITIIISTITFPYKPQQPINHHHQPARASNIS
ncbi:hypothetical protein L211DRAFT_25362 [Terfezia boudieri ATCC MYA-4762]|uniref:Uncharacterized protein n=1 Tax=Terfezia boudieri ATCC MYA-4762 TaxID=1051890 RepID=A0A3N4M3G4_9PEZI|nr:hypothetical protein L211DRAFT_25362 [Terfezia boudieri ATCC MYA-4762]